MGDDPNPEYIRITKSRLWVFVLIVWVTTILASTGVSYIAAGISADRSSHQQCLDRQSARKTSTKNALANVSFYTYQRTEANREITEANRQIAAGATGVQLDGAKAAISRNVALIAHIPDITILPKIDC